MRCSVTGCCKQTVGRGWCGMHYARWRRHGDPQMRDYYRAAGPSPTETRVLLRLAQGWLPSEIAAELGMAPQTVSEYRRRLLVKFELQTNAQLTAYALLHGLIVWPFRMPPPSKDIYSPRPSRPPNHARSVQ